MALFKLIKWGCYPLICKYINIILETGPEKEDPVFFFQAFLSSLRHTSNLANRATKSRHSTGRNLYSSVKSYVVKRFLFCIT